MEKENALFLKKEALQQLLDALVEQGYACVGPQVKNGAIVYQSIEKAEQLPWGIREKQAAGQYRLEKADPDKAFSWANGPEAIKPLLFKASETVWKVVRDSQGKLQFQPTTAAERPQAVIGARACDLAAMAIQDKVFIEGDHPDPRYKQRRENLFIIAVNCAYASNNCFCVSAGTGPEVKAHYDLLMDELKEGFLIQSATKAGDAILARLKLEKSTKKQRNTAEAQIQATIAMQKKRIPYDNKAALRDILFSHLDHPRWDDVAERCLSCGNCTAVCPTCFCHNEKDSMALDGQETQHIREWDSCFSAGHSVLAGRPIREDTKKRYRQWLTHKVGSWHDQFDSSGCVGCGRCISWCPVGIDLTEELAAISGQSNEWENLDDESDT